MRRLRRGCTFRKNSIMWTCGGLDGFFDVWVRKEAFAKCTGLGIFSDMPSVVKENSELVSAVDWKDRQYFFTDIEISPDLRCAVCTDDEVQVGLRIL